MKKPRMFGSPKFVANMSVGGKKTAEKEDAGSEDSASGMWSSELLGLYRERVQRNFANRSEVF